MEMPGRHGNSPDYRFGFNGMEKDDEAYGVSGSSYDFGARLYSSRLGRWLSTDPKEYETPSWSTYISFLNNPVRMIDPDGESAEAEIVDDKTVVVRVNLIFYGGGASTELAKTKASNIQ